MENGFEWNTVKSLLFTSHFLLFSLFGYPLYWTKPDCASLSSVIALENIATNRTVLEVDLLWRFLILQHFFGGRPLGLGCMVGFFWGEEDIYYTFFFGRIRQYLSRSIQKWIFWDFTSLFWPRQYFGLFFWQIFDFGKSTRTNRKISLIPTYSDCFRTFKKSLLVPINQSINLLTLFVRNCICVRCPRHAVYVRFSITCRQSTKYK